LEMKYIAALLCLVFAACSDVTSSETSLEVRIDANGLNKRIESGQYDGFDLWNKQFNDALRNVKCSKDIDRGVLTVAFDFRKELWKTVINGHHHLLIRLFDKNGSYLTHFICEEQLWKFARAKAYTKNLYGKDVILKETGNRFQYEVAIRDLRDASIVEIGMGR
jgi:hypothetical protein